MTINKSHFKWIVYAILSVTLFVGCGSQPEVTSPEAMSLIKKVYTAANSKSEKRLTDSEAEFQELIAAKKLTPAEEQAFLEIIDLARKGEWDTAQKRALSFAEAQVR